MAKIYNHNGTGGAVRADSAHHAAEILARRAFGRRGCVHHVRMDSHTKDGSEVRHEARIGKPAPREGDMATAITVWIYERNT